MTFGRVVPVTTEYVDGGGALARIWYVAVDDDEGAVQAVWSANGVASGDLVDVLGQLAADDVGKIGLVAGEARPYP